MRIDDEERFLVLFLATIERRECTESKGKRVTVRKGKRYLFQLLSSTRFFSPFVFALISMAGVFRTDSFSSPSPSSREWSIDLSATRSLCALTYYNRLGLRLVTNKRYKFYAIDIDLDPSDLERVRELSRVPITGRRNK